MGNGYSQFITLFLCHSLFLICFLCSSVGSLSWDTVLCELLQDESFPQVQFFKSCSIAGPFHGMQSYRVLHRPQSGYLLWCSYPWAAEGQPPFPWSPQAAALTCSFVDLGVCRVVCHIFLTPLSHSCCTVFFTLLNVLSQR